MISSRLTISSLYINLSCASVYLLTDRAEQLQTFFILWGIACLAVPVSAYAGSISLDHTFQTQSPQSMWGPGPAFQFDYNKFYGVNLDSSGSVGGIGCSFLGCYGAKLSGATSGQIGVTVGLGLNGGSATAMIPVNLGMGFPDSVQRGDTVNITSSALFGTGQLSTVSPTLNAFLNADLTIHASVSAQGCITFCPPSIGGTLIDLNVHPELVAINRDNDGELRLIGAVKASIEKEIKVKTVPITASVSYPTVTTQGTGTTHITSSGSDPFLAVKADFVGLATKLLALPPLSGSLGPINYSLLSAGVGLDLSLRQSFAFDPYVMVSLKVLETGQLFYFLAGQSISFSMPSMDFHVTPTFFVKGLFSNDTSIDLSPNVFASGGEFSFSYRVAKLRLGPLFDRSYTPVSGGISVFNNSFTLDGFDSFKGPTFLISSVPEPVTWLLVGTGMAFLLVWQVYRHRNIPYVSSGVV